MTNPITTLTCPSCGSRLSIVKGVDRFACGHCGNEHIVKRESGIVYLEPIAEDIRHIRTGVDNLRGGVDKTAAELAIPRLTKEIGELEGKLEAARNIKISNNSIPMSTAESFLLIGSIATLFLLPNSPYLFWLPLLCLIAFLYCWRKRDLAIMEMKREVIQAKEEAITAAQTLVNDKKAALERTRKLLD